MASNWMYMTSQNAYDTLIKLNFPHEMALRIKNEMPYGLSDYIQRIQVANVKAQEANPNSLIYLSSVLSLFKQATLANYFYKPINLANSTDLADNLFSDLNQIKGGSEWLQQPIKYKQTTTKKNPVKRVKKQVIQKQEPPQQMVVVKQEEKLKSVDPDYVPISRSSSESSLASLTSSPVKQSLATNNVVFRDSTNISQNINFMISQKVKKIEKLIHNKENHLNDNYNNYESKSSNEPGIKFLSDDLIPLPKFSFRIQEALVNKTQCLKYLPEIARETIEYYITNNFVIASTDHKRIAQALLDRYDILHHSALVQVEQDYIKLKTKQRSKPWALISKQLAIALRNLKASNRQNQVCNASDSSDSD